MEPTLMSDTAAWIVLASWAVMAVLLAAAQDFRASRPSVWSFGFVSALAMFAVAELLR